MKENGSMDVSANYQKHGLYCLSSIRLYEGHRFNDLRRWKLLTESPYNIKTTQRFDRAEAFDPNADPKERKVVNFREEVVTQRKLSSKHYWLPFKTDDVTMYPEFYQNPGW